MGNGLEIGTKFEICGNEMSMTSRGSFTCRTCEIVDDLGIMGDNMRYYNVKDVDGNIIFMAGYRIYHALGL